MKYQIRINGQLLGEMDRSDIERRSSKWRGTGASIEIAPAGNNNFVPLDSFAFPIIPDVSLPAGGLSRASSGAAITAWGSSDTYPVRINGQQFANLKREEIERRAARWANANVEVGDPAAQRFVSLQQFLRSAPRIPAKAAGPAIPVPTTSHSPIPPFGAGPYYVQLNGGILGPLERSEIQRRSLHWPATAVVAEDKSGPFVGLSEFLRMSQIASVAAPQTKPQHQATPPSPTSAKRLRYWVVGAVVLFVIAISAVLVVRRHRL